jgi:two-component system nitrogen regulation response regulator NtrX
MPSGTLAARTDAFERETIRLELERSQHSMTEAARALGLERSHLYKKCAQLGIDIKSLRRPEE